MEKSQKELAKEIRSPILVRYVISGETWLNNFWGMMFPIFYTYTLNELLLETQLSVDLV